MSEDDKEAARAAMVALEDQFAAAKEGGGASMELKIQLREARARFRRLRDAHPDPLGPGDATVTGGVG